MPSHILESNGLLPPTLALPFQTPRTPKKNGQKRPSKGTPKNPNPTRLKPVSGDVFYHSSTPRVKKERPDVGPSKRRRLERDENKENRENDGVVAVDETRWKSDWNRAPGYGLLSTTTTTNNVVKGNKPHPSPVPVSSVGIKQEEKEEETEFMKHLLEDIDLDPTCSFSPPRPDPYILPANLPERTPTSSPGKRKRSSLEHVNLPMVKDEREIDHIGKGVEDEFGLGDWDWGDYDLFDNDENVGTEGKGAVMIGLDEVKGEQDVGSFDQAREVRIEKTRNVSTVEVVYESELSISEPSKPLISGPSPIPTPTIKPTPQPHPDQPVLEDTYDDFPFDLPLSQESSNHPTSPSLEPTKPLERYPIWHPLVHPPSSSATTSTVSSPSTSGGTDRWRPTPWARCSVLSIQRGEEGQGARWGWGEKVLIVQDVRRGTRYLVRLREDAAGLRVLIGDVVNIISPLVKDPSDPIKTPLKPALTRKVRTLQPSLPENPITFATGIPLTLPPDLSTREEEEGEEDETIEIIVSHKYPDNFLIHHPDFLIPMTSLAGSLGCRRKPIVQTLLKNGAQSATTKPLLYGNILHELLQASLRSREFDIFALKSTLDLVLHRPQMQLDMWAAELGIEDVRAEVWEKASTGLFGFGEKWVGGRPKGEAVLHNSTSRLALTGLHDIEESIWSPKWGMKGKVDASVQATLVTGKPNSRNQKETAEEGREETIPKPFEIKTGRAVGIMEHRAQTMLYTLLMEERYQTKIGSGLLYYTQTDSMLEVNAAKPEIRGLLSARNELAGYLARKRIVQEKQRIRSSQKANGKSSSFAPPSFVSQATQVATQASGSAVPFDIEDIGILPPTVENARECRSCYASDSCMLYRKTVERVAHDMDDPLNEIYQRKVGHLTHADSEFFSKWEQLITLEEQDTIQHKNEAWTRTAADRERSGRCFADMVIKTYVDQSETTLSKIARHIYTFVRSEQSVIERKGSFLNGHIGKNDPVSLSIEPDLLTMAVGFVVSLTPTEVTIGTNQKLDLGALLERSGKLRDYGQDYEPVFRIDKDEMLSGTTRMRSNLAQMFYSEESGGDTRRRDLIVRLEEPRFESVWAPDAEEIPDHLNEDQRNAMTKVLTAKDYACILGMPGTGKTTTIAEIILALVKRGKSVLLTSYTHSAVDTILTKLVNSDHKILRLGNIEKVHPDVRHLTLDAFADPSSISQMDEILMSPQIVATTCLSIDHPLFIRRRFDYCIVDEASQITLPTCIGPLRYADTFVLVGDHFQLPPIVKNVSAKRGGLDSSLFRLLTDAYPCATVDLGYQYRMNEDIMSLSNKLIYSGRLKCGSDKVRDQELVLPREKGGGKCGCWLDRLLEPSARSVFVDTDKVPALESKVGDLVQNRIEADLVYKLVSTLITRGIRSENIGVITPYRQQIKLIGSLLDEEYAGVEVMTADKSQGRDKDCIVISMVRSNEVGNIGELLRDWRRINVSLTRAKKKLIIFGSKMTLQTDRLLNEFFGFMEEKGWMTSLPEGANEVGCCGVSVGEVAVT